jgi:hypothetical protein
MAYIGIVEFNGERLKIRFHSDDSALRGLLGSIDGRLVLAVKGVREHAVYVNDLAGWSGLEFLLQSTGTTLNNGWARSLGQLHVYRFFAALGAGKYGREFLLDNFDDPSTASTQTNPLPFSTVVMNCELFQGCIFWQNSAERFFHQESEVEQCNLGSRGLVR